MTASQYVFLALGVLNVALGTAGIFLPLLPTTPFLLLAAYLFARSSPRWHSWLLSHRRLGPYIHAFRTKSGLTRSQKLRMAAAITVALWTSAYIAPVPAIKAMLIAMWFFWTALLFCMKTAAEPSTFPDVREPERPENEPSYDVGEAAPAEQPRYPSV
jgi:uncharacterized membrane protein YbaN (DUF454 family)